MGHPVLLCLEGLEVARQVGGSKVLVVGVEFAHLAEDGSPDRHPGGAVSVCLGAESQNGNDVRLGVLAVIGLCQAGQVGGMCFQRAGERTVSAAFCAMALRAVAGVHQLSVGGIGFGGRYDQFSLGLVGEAHGQGQGRCHGGKQKRF